jgi:serine/threonine protein kinase
MPSRFPNYSGQAIDSGRLVLLSVLGEGGSSVVYKAVDAIDPERPLYAVKWLGLPLAHENASADTRRAYLEGLDAEYFMHASVSDYPNIVTLHRIIVDDVRDCRWLVLDYHPGGDLFSSINEHNPLWKNEARTRRIFLQLVDAITHCHNRQVFHRDIKPENILISSNGDDVYLSDFGLATRDRFCTQAVGTDFYNSPGTSLKTR